MLKIENMSFDYSKKRLFNNLCLEVDPGLHGLLGKNGAGKSSLLKLISGELYPSKGICTAMGFDASKRRPAMLSEIYFLPEEFSVPQLTGDEYVKYYSPFYPRFSLEFFQTCAKEFEIAPSKKLDSMSYGQRKKFMISFGLATWSSILLLDEPTNGLDIPSKSQFRRMAAAGASDERVILVSTHQVKDMEKLIDPIIILEDGKIIFNHTVEEITKNITFTVMKDEPTGKNVIYFEKGLGGYFTAINQKGGEDRALDLEFLFNMVVNNSKAVREAIEGGVK